MILKTALTGLNARKSDVPNGKIFLTVSAHYMSKSTNIKTLAVDSIDWMEGLIHKAVAKADGKENIEEIGYGRGYKLALDYWTQFCKA